MSTERKSSVAASDVKEKRRVQNRQAQRRRRQRLATRFAALEAKVTRLTTLLRENGMGPELLDSEGCDDYTNPTACSREETVTEPLNVVPESTSPSTTSNQILTANLAEIVANIQFCSMADGERTIVPSYAPDSNPFSETIRPTQGVRRLGDTWFDVGYEGSG
ncbi:hypothetical protein T310_7578, partial [Rasamsonia emersonii CBS 393.64]